MTAGVAPLCAWWRVEVVVDVGRVLVAIEPEMLAGDSELSDGDLDVIRYCGRALLLFAGGGE